MTKKSTYAKFKARHQAYKILMEVGMIKPLDPEETLLCEIIQHLKVKEVFSNSLLRNRVHKYLARHHITK